jgi:hypothetical protein
MRAAVLLRANAPELFAGDLGAFASKPLGDTTG